MKNTALPLLKAFFFLLLLRRQCCQIIFSHETRPEISCLPIPRLLNPLWQGNSAKHTHIWLAINQTPMHILLFSVLLFTVNFLAGSTSLDTEGNRSDGSADNMLLLKELS